MTGQSDGNDINLTEIRSDIELHRHDGKISRFEWSPDGQRIALACLGGSRFWGDQIAVWNVEKCAREWAVPFEAEGYHGLAWSPDGQKIVSGTSFYDETGSLPQKLQGDGRMLEDVAWSPNHDILASGCNDDVNLWHAESGELIQILRGHSGRVECIAWSHDGRIVASGSQDGSIRLWGMDGDRAVLLRTLNGHSRRVISISWSPDGSALASGADDNTVRIWSKDKEGQTRILEGHIGPVACVAFASDGQILASASWDGSVRLWRHDQYEMIGALHIPHLVHAWIAFHPQKPVLATLGQRAQVIQLWSVDLGALSDTTSTIGSVSYVNAKVVLVGDSGVGKSGLSLVLTGQPFVATESTHGRRVWTFENSEVELDRSRVMREALLWDLAGQPGYRLIHQLHLNEIAVALVVFDARSETDPFAGVRHWERALRQAQRLQGDYGPSLKKFLVAARADRGGIGVTKARIDSLMKDLKFDGYFETSAKERWNVVELVAAIREGIKWESLPRVTSTELFQRIKSFIIGEKEEGRTLSTLEDLYRTYKQSNTSINQESEGIPGEFVTCIGRVEAAGLIKRLSFGNLILLQPELLDAYASTLVNAAKDEPDGLGCVLEEDARSGRFRMPEGERLNDREKEKLLLIATVEDLLRYEIALREQGDEGSYLVFPSQLTRENPDLPDPEGKAVTYSFEGPVLNVYATLAVRLSHSGLFRKKEMWKNAASYQAKKGGAFGMFLRQLDEGKGSITLFFDKAASIDLRFQFEEYVRAHLERRALPETINRTCIFACSACGTPVSELQAAKRYRDTGLDWISCNVCDTRVSLIPETQYAAVTSAVPQIDIAADAGRELGAAASVIQGKIATNDFDVFLCHNSLDKPAVKVVGEILKKKGILPWLDEWELRPGLPWQRSLEQQILQIKAAAVFVGKSGIGPWEDVELSAFLREFIKRGCPVIPVLLADAGDNPKLPLFLEAMAWVDFRATASRPLERLIWGITGVRGRH
jgi:WD40 repeat protein